jgi:lipoprotein-releasing system permease protein
MNGCRAELFNKIVSLNGYAVVQGHAGRLPDWHRFLDDARRTPGLTSTTPLIEQPLIASYEGRVKGMLTCDIHDNSAICDKVLAGSPALVTTGSNNVRIARGSPKASVHSSAARSA